MNAVATAVQPLEVELMATRQLRRKLNVRRDAHGFHWVGVYPPGKWRVGITRCLGCISTYDPTDISIDEFEDGEISLAVRGALFEVTRAEADRLIAAFGFEVKKL